MQGRIMESVGTIEERPFLTLTELKDALGMEDAKPLRAMIHRGELPVVDLVKAGWVRPDDPIFAWPNHRLRWGVPREAAEELIRRAKEEAKARLERVAAQGGTLLPPGQTDVWVPRIDIRRALGRELSHQFRPLPNRLLQEVRFPTGTGPKNWRRGRKGMIQCVKLSDLLLWWELRNLESAGREPEPFPLDKLLLHQYPAVAPPGHEPSRERELERKARWIEQGVDWGLIEERRKKRGVLKTRYRLTVPLEVMQRIEKAKQEPEVSRKDGQP